MKLSHPQAVKVCDFVTKYYAKALAERTQWAAMELDQMRGNEPDLAAWIAQLLAHANDPDSIKRTRMHDTLATGIPEGYRVIEKNTGHSFRELYRCMDVYTQHEVGIKVLSEQIVNLDPEWFSYLAESLKRLGKLKHRHVVEVIDAGIKDGKCYVIMDWLRGCTLAAKLAEWKSTHHPEKWRMLAQWIAQLAGEVDAAYQVGVIFYDLKPDNIVFSDDSQIGTPKIIDLDGVALVRNGVVLRPDMIKGTGFFKTPEHTGKGSIGPWTPVYSLGVILYLFLRYGAEPFPPSLGAGQLTDSIQQKAPRAITMPPEGFSSAQEAEAFQRLSQIALISMRKIPGRAFWRRYVDGAHLREHLQMVADGKSPFAGLPTQLLIPLSLIGDLYDRKRHRAYGYVAILFAAAGVISFAYLWMAETQSHQNDVKKASQETEKVYNDRLSSALADLKLRPEHRRRVVDLGKLVEERPNDIVPALALSLAKLTECRYDEAQLDAINIGRKLVDNSEGRMEAVFGHLIKLHILLTKIDQDGGLEDADYKKMSRVQEELVKTLNGAPHLREILGSVPLFELIVSASQQVSEEKTPQELPPAPYDTLNRVGRVLYWRMDRLRLVDRKGAAAEVYFLEAANHLAIAEHLFKECVRRAATDAKKVDVSLTRGAENHFGEASQVFRKSREAVPVAPQSKLRHKARIGEGVADILRLRLFPGITHNEIDAIRENLGLYSHDAENESPEFQLVGRVFLLTMLMAERKENERVLWNLTEADFAKRWPSMELAAKQMLLAWEADERRWQVFGNLECSEAVVKLINPKIKSRNLVDVSVASRMRANETFEKWSIAERPVAK